MFFSKENRKLDKEIMSNFKNMQNDDTFTIDVKVENSNQVFSKYNYNKDDTLNYEFCDHLLNNAKLMPSTSDMKIRIHSSENLDASKVKNALKSHFSRDYAETKLDLLKTKITALTSLILGILSLAILIIFYNVFDNFYITTIIEIIAWVFVWEAADKFFYDRTQIKRKCLILQKIYTAQVEVEK